VLTAGNVIRKHELGAAFSRTLLLIPQWRPFFEGSPIDPIRDVDHLLLTAPRLRSDTSKMVVTMDFNVAEPLIRAAVDSLVQRANGEWLDNPPSPPRAPGSLTPIGSSRWCPARSCSWCCRWRPRISSPR
jgi:hypothetical protein